MDSTAMPLSAADVAAVTRNNDGYGCGDGMGFGGGWWTIILFAMIFGWGGNGFGNRGNCGGQPVTEAGLCNAMNFNNLENAVGRGFDQQSQFAFQSQRDLCTSTATLSNQMTNGFYGIQGQLAECCCTTNRNIDQLRYDGAMNTAAINANTTAMGQKILDKMNEQENAALRGRIQQLELQSQLCGIVRYPTATTYATGCNPFFGGGCGCGCNNWGSGNI